MKKRRRRKLGSGTKTPLTTDQILAWADAYRGRHGRWPKRYSGYIDGTLDEKWSAVEGALTLGHRGLPKGSSLAKLLAEHRGFRHRNYLPGLKVNTILAWADAHFGRTGVWPTKASGPITGAP